MKFAARYLCECYLVLLGVICLWWLLVLSCFAGVKWVMISTGLKSK